MNILKIKTKAFTDQKPGTGGLRKETKIFMSENYIENFIQSSLNVKKKLTGEINSWTIGGDGRYPNTKILPKILKMLIANGIKQVFVIHDLITPTPAISHIIRKYKADGGFIFSASHNPGGINGDFGIKVEENNGGGAAENITNAIYEESKIISEYLTCDITDDEILNYSSIKYIDPITDYADLMESMFDFTAIKKWFDAGHTFRFNALNASTGPVAKEIFVKRLGAKTEWILNSVPMEDFGGIHPEPNPTYAKEFYDDMMNGMAEFGAACDGDGDRNMILGNNFYVIPADSLGVMVKYHNLIPYFKNGLKGVARSKPTSSAVDLVAKKMNLPIYTTPVGWKYFATLLDADKISLCGEESFGQGGDYIREKDGIFAILFWLNILAKTGKSVAELVHEMWEQNGRVFYSQYSYENVDKDAANNLLQEMITCDLTNKEYDNFKILSKEIFNYTDPITSETATNQGIEIMTYDKIRIFFRLSGTGTKGATLRFYIEKYENDRAKYSMQAKEYLRDIYILVENIFKLKEYFGDIKPTAIN